MESVDSDAGAHGPTSQPPALEAVNLSLGFAAIMVLDTVSEAMSAPAVTCLLGQAGSGKTTFLRALNRGERQSLRLLA